MMSQNGCPHYHLKITETQTNVLLCGNPEIWIRHPTFPPLEYRYLLTVKTNSNMKTAVYCSPAAAAVNFVVSVL